MSAFQHLFSMRFTRAFPRHFSSSSPVVVALVERLISRQQKNLGNLGMCSVNYIKVVAGDGSSQVCRHLALMRPRFTVLAHLSQVSIFRPLLSTSSWPFLLSAFIWPRFALFQVSAFYFLLSVFICCLSPFSPACCSPVIS
jgi:hypothetical protein